MRSTQPNIVFILTDDQGAWAMGCAGNSEIQTPNLDAIAAQGIRFDNFFCASPVCSPARASLITGRIPSAHGVHDWIRSGSMPAIPGLPVFGEDQCAIEYLKGMRAYTETLAENGYLCGISGKWHLGDSLNPQKCFSYWNVFPYGGSNHYYNPVMVHDGRVEIIPGYLTDVITDGAIRFLDEAQQSQKPFYLSVHYTAPHSPWEQGQHPEELCALYANCAFETCPDEPCHPNQINSAPRGTGAKRIELLKGYYAAITGLDRGVGRILRHLEALGLRENTLVIFGGDNGMNMGHHGIWGKGNATFPLNMYDTSVKVPFLISWPGHLPQGIVDETLLSHYDFFPTLIDFLGISDPATTALPGRSFAPLLRGQTLEAHQTVVVYDEYGPVRMIRSRTHKYIHRYPYGPHEFYDLVDDPGERTNRIQDPGMRAKIAELKAEMDEFFLKYVDPDLDGARLGVTGKGQIMMVGTRSQGRPTFDSDWWYIDADGSKK